MATTGIADLVVGSDRVDFYLTYTDENDLPINIGGVGVLVKVQGKSNDLPGVDLNVSGVVFSDGSAGIAKFAAFGNAVTVGNLGALPSATYTLRGYLRDVATKTTYTPEFQVRWSRQPV